MKTPSWNCEARRSAEVHAFAMSEAPTEGSFDRLVRRAATALRVPVALVSLIDRERQWFRAGVGLDWDELGRETSFCDQAIFHRAPLVVEDATDDRRFRAAAPMMGIPGIGFYAGIPLVTKAGNSIGALCAIDYRPRRIDAADRILLKRLAGAAMGQITMRSLLRDMYGVLADGPARADIHAAAACCALACWAPACSAA